MIRVFLENGQVHQGKQYVSNWLAGTCISPFDWRGLRCAKDLYRNICSPYCGLILPVECVGTAHFKRKKIAATTERPRLWVQTSISNQSIFISAAVQRCTSAHVQIPYKNRTYLGWFLYALKIKSLAKNTPEILIKKIIISVQNRSSKIHNYLPPYKYFRIKKKNKKILVSTALFK